MKVLRPAQLVLVVSALL